MRWFAPAAVITLAAASLSCEVGQGVGSVRGSLKVNDCQGKDLSSYDMSPDFFAGNAAQNQLLIRIQRGGDLQEYNDNLNIVVDDTTQVQDGATIDVQLMRPAGSAPSVPAPLVRITLSLRGTCGTGKLNPDPPQVVLHAVSGTITFKHILRGDPSSEDTNSKRIEGSFNVVMEDPRYPVGAVPRSAGTLTGDFKFFYQRGGPAQPFP